MVLKLSEAPESWGRQNATPGMSDVADVGWIPRIWMSRHFQDNADVAGSDNTSITTDSERGPWPEQLNS